MVDTRVLRCIFNSHDVARILDHAYNRPFTLMAAANCAELRVADVVAGIAISYPGPQFIQRVRKRERVFLPLLDEVKHQSQSGFFSDTRKLRDLIDSLFNKFGREFHGSVKIVYSIRASMPASQIASRKGRRKSKTPDFTAHLPL